MRRFVYDNRGFLDFDEHPEIDGLVDFFDYDPRGHAGRKAVGIHDLIFLSSAGETRSDSC